jgi:hypothetical protein
MRADLQGSRRPCRARPLAIFPGMEWLTGRPAKRPGSIEPCIPTRASKPPVGPQWIHEIKHDGYRLISRKRWRAERTSPHLVSPQHDQLIARSFAGGRGKLAKRP